ncbi:WSSV390 [White spot syndrome virus]|uniref:WSSV390 n=1 Tax=White spot syndrome virus TaxID=342409 RepID=A0A2I6SC75_9VIRU|nr:WSSV390 [White spot syndrome virus]
MAAFTADPSLHLRCRPIHTLPTRRGEIVIENMKTMQKKCRYGSRIVEGNCTHTHGKGTKFILQLVHIQ